MDRAVYDAMEAQDQRHWWYRARRKVLSALIARCTSLPLAAEILEVGCGTGHNLEMLSHFGSVNALEIDPAARAVAEKRLGKPVLSSPLPQLAGVPRGHFDLVGSFDVIEHIDDDTAAVAAIAECLKPGGKFVATVPAHPWMWSAHDVVNHHVRRYSAVQFRELFDRSPLRLERMGYFNSLLFPVAVAERMVSKVRGKDDSDLSTPAAPVNAALEKTFAAERHLVGRVPLPPGLSLFAVASAR
ncbi:class I SAM-dependent methyltransferase [Sphingomonas piscis]|uniref:Class I SAM-dependent methyltransferase n=1 Tax=Sphingomonas piscis TaxID=2714943 RepID=A0A6G7YP47_9SPHN|nr:class I SAM-dependent methyltransferase [Sphingomonas piscis]QIK78518.1 class I SAM-dependent methyltransferase [Sphingomonas piscis]